MGPTKIPLSGSVEGQAVAIAISPTLTTVHTSIADHTDALELFIVNTGATADITIDVDGTSVTYEVSGGSSSTVRMAIADGAVLKMTGETADFRVLGEAERQRGKA